MIKSKIKISFIVPCFNEESNIINTIEEILKISNKCLFKPFELIIVDDGSTDKTFQKIKIYENIRKYKHKKNIGIGAAYKTGLKKSKGEYIIMIPGDNSHPLSSIEPIIKKIGKSDIIIPFTTKKGKRSIARFFLSKIFTFLINIFFNLNIKYFNGTVLHKKKLLDLIKIKSNGFDYQAEILIKLIREGFSYDEVEVFINEREEGTSKAVSLSNGFKIMWNLISLKKELGSS
tara:strand:+ start:2094 stop:2789 length:696 start_codon:yes stop_codon:yes gene_type:complete